MNEDEALAKVREVAERAHRPEEVTNGQSQQFMDGFEQGKQAVAEALDAILALSAQPWHRASGGFDTTKEAYEYLSAQEAATEVEWGVGYSAEDVAREDSEADARRVVASWIAALGFDDGWTVFRRTLTSWQEVPADE